MEKKGEGVRGNRGEESQKETDNFFPSLTSSPTGEGLENKGIIERLKPGCTCPKCLFNQKKINLAKFTYWCLHMLTCLAGGELKPAVGAWRLLARVSLPPCLLPKHSRGRHALRK